MRASKTGLRVPNGLSACRPVPFGTFGHEWVPLCNQLCNQVRCPGTYKPHFRSSSGVYEDKGKGQPTEPSKRV